MTPFIRLMMKKRLSKGKEDAKRVPERMGIGAFPRPEGKLIWCHGASVGESLSLLPIIDRLRSEQPAASIMVTTGTVTSAALMAERLPEGVFHQFIPVDHPSWVDRFLAHWRPNAVLWLESDLWPHMLMHIKRHNIPAVLLNARMSAPSFSKWNKYGRSLIKPILAAFDIVLAQNTSEAERYRTLGHQNAHVSSNLKYAAAPLPSDQGKLSDLKEMITGRAVWQFVSTHPGEEEQAVWVHKRLKQSHGNLLTVIVPRHPNRGDDIAELIEGEGLNAAQRSKGEAVDTQTDFYIADTLGELGLFFAAIPFVVMGGSFIPHGGHNPIEPGQFGSSILYGPHMFNFITICHDFETAGAALPLDGKEHLAQMLDGFLKDPESAQTYQTAAKALTAEKSAALDEMWGHIGPWLTDALGQNDHKGDTDA